MNDTISGPQKSSVKVPPGRVLVNKKWRGSQLGKELQAKTNAVYSDAMGFVDFFPSDSCAVVYITESEMVTGDSYKQKIRRLYEHYCSKGVVVADQSSLGNFQELQDLATLELEMTTLPISSQSELPVLLTQMSYVEGKLPNNPFKTRSSNMETENMEEEQLLLLRQIPGVGNTNALKMLKSYGHVNAISMKGVERLRFKIGAPLANSVYKFFNDKVSVSTNHDEQ